MTEPETYQTSYSNESEGESDTTTTTLGMPVVRQLMVLGLLLVALLSTSAVPKVVAKLQSHELVNTNAHQPASAQSALDTTPIAPFSDVTVQGTSAFVWDVNTQRILYEKNPDSQLPLASITKLMTALVAYEVLSENTTVSVPTLALAQDGESGLSEGEVFSLDTLTDLTLMSSSNDGAFAIATVAGTVLDDTRPVEAFVEAMNIRANELGLTQTYFRNPTGLDITETEAGAYGSARDISFLMEHILTTHPEILESTTKKAEVFYNENGQYHQAENTNHIVNQIPGIIGSKTGYTTLSGGNLAIVFDTSLNRPIIVVVLDSSYNGRFNDVVTLSEAVQNKQTGR